MCICIIIYILLYVADLLLLLLDTRDEKWNSEWVRESSWLWTFTVFIIAIVFIMTPNPTSDLLAHIDEILDETLTEMPTHEDGHNESMEHHNDIEMHQFDAENLDYFPSEKSES